MPNRKITFTTITNKGALFPTDFLEKLAGGDKSIEGIAEWTLQQIRNMLFKFDLRSILFVIVI